MSEPTPEEREALRGIIALGSYQRTADDKPYADVADRIVAAGYRLPVPEPGKSIADRIHFDAAVSNRAREVVDTRKMVEAFVASQPVTITDEMVEAAARAMDRDLFDGNHNPALSAFIARQKQDALAIARAALSAALEGEA